MGFGHFVSRLASGEGHETHGGVGTKSGGKAHAGPDGDKAAANAAKKEDQERKKLAAQDRGLARGVEYDPKSITEHENWQTFSHQQIYAINQNSLQEAHVSGLAGGWRTLASELAKVGPQLQHDAARALRGAWEGEAAEVANKAGEPLVEWMHTSSQAFRLTGNKLDEAGTAAGQVKAAVPPPQGYGPGGAVAASIPQGLAGGGTDAVRQMQERQQSERAAQETMARVYTSVYGHVDGTVPAYTNLDKSPAAPPHPAGAGDLPSNTQSAGASSAPAGLAQGMPGATSLGGGAAGGAGGVSGMVGTEMVGSAGAAGGARGVGAMGSGNSSSAGTAPVGRGAGARRGGDDEHDHPSWLEENDDIWLDDMPKTAPPVFGE